MPDLTILRPPSSMRSGDDVYGAETIAGLTREGISTRVHDLWPDWWARNLWHSKFKQRKNMFNRGPAAFSLWRHGRRIRDSKVVWLEGPSKRFDVQADFEKQILGAGKAYVFQLGDDWFFDKALAETAGARVPLATVMVVPIERLRQRVLSLYPEANVVVFEAPIDVKRLAPPRDLPRTGLPMIVWSGNPNNLKEVPGLSELLCELHREVPFLFRVVSGSKRPSFSLPLTWEWHPYDPATEGRLLAGAAAALSPIGEDNSYTRCKGSYKVKTYFAAGAPVVATPIGHQETIVEPGENGFHATSPAEWKSALLALLKDRDLAERMGRAAREYAVNRLSHEALMPVWAAELKRQIASLNNHSSMKHFAGQES